MGQVELLNSYEKDGQDDLDNDKGEGLSILDVTSILVVTSFTFLPHLVKTLMWCEICNLWMFDVLQIGVWGIYTSLGF